MRSIRVTRPDGRMRTSAPGAIVPDAIWPAKPRKSWLGRLTHCTGMRSGLAASAVDVERHRVEMLEQARARVPRHRSLRLMTLSPLRPDTGIATHSAIPILLGEFAIIGDDRVERALVVIDQVHLVHGKHEAADADQLGEIGMAPGLGQHALARIDQQHGEVGGRRAGHHVARILLVARRVGDDELASARSRRSGKRRRS